MIGDRQNDVFGKTKLRGASFSKKNGSVHFDANEVIRFKRPINQ